MVFNIHMYGILNLWRSIQIQQVIYRTSICTKFGLFKIFFMHANLLHYVCLFQVLVLHKACMDLVQLSDRWSILRCQMSAWGRIWNIGAVRFLKTISQKTFDYTRNNFKPSLTFVWLSVLFQMQQASVYYLQMCLHKWCFCWY